MKLSQQQSDNIKRIINSLICVALGILAMFAYGYNRDAVPEIPGYHMVHNGENLNYIKDKK
jgi:hypothetical protein